MFNLLNSYIPINIQKLNNIIINLDLTLNLLVLSVIIIVAIIIISHFGSKLIMLKMTKDRVRFSFAAPNAGLTKTACQPLPLSHT
jgi:hypothetical protein